VGSIQGRSGNPFDRVQKKVATFADHMNVLVWETLAQHSKTACICTLFKAYTGEWAWKAIRDRLQGPCYLSKEYHIRKIRSRAQKQILGNILL
jgi:hypothetical protein